MSNSSAVAQQIARGLVAAGVTEVVFAPGSRSAPLVYALAPLAEAGLIRTHVRLDERDAGFLALGLARGLRVRESRRRASDQRGASAEQRRASTGQGPRSGQRREAPVALVTTSGSAVANLHPAVLEASYGHLPLLAITADRPARLRGTGANQTLDDQSQVLSDVRAAFDVAVDGGSEVGCGSEVGRGTAVDRVVHDRVRGVEDLLAEAIARSLGESIGPGGERISTGRSQADPGRMQAGPGPVQFNVQFDVPLVPTEDELTEWQAEIAEKRPRDFTGADADADAGADEDNLRREVQVPLGAIAESGTSAGTVIVAGDASGHSADQLIALAQEHGIPVLAEPSSPLTAASTFVPSHARVLAERPGLRAAIRTVLVHGKPTLTRPIAALLADESVEVHHLPDDIDEADLVLIDEADLVIIDDPVDGAGDPEAGDDASGTWLEEWRAAGTDLASAPATSVAAEVAEYLAASEITLFAASSNTIRYLSTVAEVKAEIHASRGLAGIDGLVSTAAGLSLALEDTVVLVIGDIAMLHDVGGLLTPSGEQPGDVVIVVLNDDGGAIFSGLEHSQDHVVGYLRRYFTVPHGRTFSDLAAAYGWDHARVASRDEFVAVFEQNGATADSKGSRTIIEVALEPVAHA